MQGANKVGQKHGAMALYKINPFTTERRKDSARQSKLKTFVTSRAWARGGYSRFFQEGTMTVVKKLTCIKGERVDK